MAELRALVEREGKVLRTERTELNSWGEDTGVSYDSIPGFKHKMRIKRLVDKRKSKNLNQDSDNSGDNDNEDF